MGLNLVCVTTYTLRINLKSDSLLLTDNLSPSDLSLLITYLSTRMPVVAIVMEKAGLTRVILQLLPHHCIKGPPVRETVTVTVCPID